MQAFLSLNNNVHEYALLIADISQVQMVSKDLQSKLSDFVVSPWQVVEEVFFKSMEASYLGNWVFLVLVMIIVFIGVLNTISMSVLERTREFGVMKAIGFRGVGLVNLIFSETIMLTLLSLLLGILVAMPLIVWFSEVGYMYPEPMDMGGIEFQHLKGELSLTKLPKHIECFDISHISGSFCVASMVCFINGKPSRKQYRRYKIKSFVGNDDFRAIEEVVTRRYQRLQKEDTPLPDLIVIDGGIGQVHAAIKAFKVLKKTPPYLIGLAKKMKRSFSQIIVLI